MKKLEEIIKCNGSVHTQLDRSKKCAIYEAPEQGFDVFISSDETYPNKNRFGLTAWNIRNRELAINRFNQIKKVHG